MTDQPLVDAPPAVALEAWLGALRTAGGLQPMPVEHRALLDAVGLVVAEDVQARHGVPAHRCAAMDGIATRAEATAGATPERPVLLAAGAYDPIDTGQHVEDRWDAVVPVEQTAPDPDGVRVLAATAPGRHVRPAGEDVPLGTVVLRPGARLTAYGVGLAAACGHATVPVVRPPLVRILPTGDELRAPDATLLPGEAVESNGPMLTARARALGVEAELLPLCPDDPEALAEAIGAAAAGCELLLVLAGSSRGRRDHAASVLAGLGQVVVRGVAQRPGHPVILAVVGSTPVVGVPGFPLAAHQSFERFARPLLDLLTRTHDVTDELVVELAADVEGRPGAEALVPLRLQPRPGALPLATPLARRGAALHGLAAADATLTLPPGAGARSGDRVAVALLGG